MEKSLEILKKITEFLKKYFREIKQKPTENTSFYLKYFLTQSQKEKNIFFEKKCYI